MSSYHLTIGIKQIQSSALKTAFWRLDSIYANIDLLCPNHNPISILLGKATDTFYNHRIQPKPRFLSVNFLLFCLPLQIQSPLCQGTGERLPRQTNTSFSCSNINSMPNLSALLRPDKYNHTVRYPLVGATQHCVIDWASAFVLVMDRA